MIPSQSDRSQFSNLQGEKVEMGFSQNAQDRRYIMSILAGLYSDRIMALIREYSTNARDSHADAGTDRPIEVTTPTALSPYFKVKDYGLGLSVEDIHNLYSKYGASTKRSSNNAAGMFGVGSKSALAYTSQFTVTAVKDGVRAVVAVSKDEDGTGSMTIVDTKATDEPNGVEVTIPARSADANAFRQKALKLFSYWEPGTVLVDGQQPASYLAEGEHIKITDDIIIRQTGYYDTDSTVIMGNVPYPAGEKLRADALGLPHRHAVVVRVPIGAVEPAPSREALAETKQTDDALDKIAEQVKSQIEAAVQREVQQAATAADAVKAVLAWKRLLGGKTRTFRWKGQELPSRIAKPDGQDGARMLITSSENYRLGSASSVSAVDLDYLDKYVFVTGYDMAKFTVTHKKKLRMWMGQQQAKDSTFLVRGWVLVNFPINTTWIDPKRVIRWEDVNALKLPTVANGGVSSYSGRLPGSYDIVRKSAGDTAGRYENGVPGDKIDMTKPVFYLHGNAWQDGRSFSPMFDHLAAYTIICLPANRIEKFKRENPKIKLVTDVIQEQYDAWVKKLTPDQKKALAQADARGREEPRSLEKHADKIKDPAILEAIRLSKIDVDALQRQRRQYERFLTRRLAIGEYTDPFDKYKLFDCYTVRYHGAAHAIGYLNACYEGGW